MCQRSFNSMAPLATRWRRGQLAGAAGNSMAPLATRWRRWQLDGAAGNSMAPLAGSGDWPGAARPAMMRRHERRPGA